MTRYVAFRTDGNLARQAALLDQELQGGNTGRQHEIATALVLDFVDVFIDRLAFDMMEQVELKPRQEKLFRNLAGFMRKTAKGMSGRVIRKMSREDLHALLGYFRERELVLAGEDAGKVYFGFPLEASSGDRIASTFEAIESGQACDVKEDYKVAIDELTDMIFTNLMDEPVRMLHMGKIMTKIMDVAFSSIRKGQQAAWKRAQPELSVDDMEKQVAFFKTLVIEA